MLLFVKKNEPLVKNFIAKTPCFVSLLKLDQKKELKDWSDIDKVSGSEWQELV
jgi:hypothetical protein